MADKPVTREEMYLAYLTGDYTGEIPKPITRKEKYLYELCLKGMGGEISPEEIKEVVGEYMQEHPFEETDPTVPDWAKRPEKPTYTAEDVGALPDNTKIPTKTSELKNDSGFLESPPTPEVGKILKIKSVNEDGTFTCEWADGGSNLDVRIDGESIVQDGVAEIPVIGNLKSGLVQFREGCGLQLINNYLLVKAAGETEITNRTGTRSSICADRTLDYAVKAAMCDGKGTAWTDAERLACLLRMGCTVDEDGFVKWTAQEVTK